MNARSRFARQLRQFFASNGIPTNRVLKDFEISANLVLPDLWHDQILLGYLGRLGFHVFHICNVSDIPVYYISFRSIGNFTPINLSEFAKESKPYFSFISLFFCYGSKVLTKFNQCIDIIEYFPDYERRLHSLAASEQSFFFDI